MNYIELLKHSYEVEKSHDYGCPPESPLEYLGDQIFNFTTYDGEMSALFARKAVEVCAAITNGTTFDYIKDAENHRWYLLMCNTEFFAGKLEWGTSIRGAWWDHEIRFQSCGLWKGDEQLAAEMKFTQDEWKDFMRAVCDFANTTSGLALATGSAVCAFCGEPAGHTLGECPASLDREQAVAGYLAARKLLRRCLPIVAADAQMMADITRHALLSPNSEVSHTRRGQP